MNNNLLSIILLSYYSSQRIVKNYNDITKLLNKNNIPFEFIIIDDGSKDDSYEVAKKLEHENSNVHAYQLSKNYTAHYATFAGLQVSNGNCALPIHDDEQMPYQTIVDMYKVWQQGEKIIIPHRESRDDGFFSDVFSNLFYKVMNYTSDIKFPNGGADTFFLDREVVDILNNKIHHINTVSIIEVLRLGFSPYLLSYQRMQGINEKSRWSFSKKIKLFRDAFFSSSTWPIKMITNIGFFFIATSIVIIAIYIYMKLFGNTEYWDENLPEWTSIAVIFSFFSGLILFSLGIVAEYIWRIYDEVKDRPGFIIKNKK
ncbi:MAG: glycosyltransferase [Ichthyobacteriaceae bacterium]|nr:glycosyltransferase [Ichthyobacteriaceae bacterium]